jgi:2-phospho-L-lactate transferase/gluconeogenesis factor (CofD/UPF0052 family)
MKIALFSGGRGSAAISQTLSSLPDVDLTIIVNAYDDGLSTGLMRRKFKGLLGPSDIRKNFSHILETQGQDSWRLAQLLEYRINSDRSQLDSDSIDLISKLFEFLDSQTQRISRRASEDLLRWMKLSLTHLGVFDDEKKIGLLADVALGNLIFAGAYLESGSDFNLAIKLWTDSFDLHSARILNVTDGENLVLVGTKMDGTFLENESAIVDKQSDVPIDRIYLLKDYLTDDQKLHVAGLSQDEVTKYLNDRHRRPEINQDVAEVLTNCDLIVYGPGTQHSSLFPSYMTRGVAEIVESRVEIEKVFIGNISEDYDIQSETVTSLLSKVASYMNSGSTKPGPISSYVSQCFVSTSQTSTTPWGMEKVDTSGHGIGFHVGQWSSDGRKHDGQRVANGLVSLARVNAELEKNPRYKTISVVIPVLNEFQRLPIVLEKLITFDWLAHDLIPEFVVVDGGSVDGSAELIQDFPVVRGLRMEFGVGRGEALTRGIQVSTGQLIVTFPADDEYDVVAIAEVASLLRTTHAPIVFGSRIGLCADTDKRLRSIYGGRSRTYYLSKWGGFTLSVLSGFFYKRWVADTLTSVKGFTRESIGSLSLNGKSADWDVRLIMDASFAEIAIAEVPVGFRPRRVDEGKKIRPKHGVRAVVTMIRGIWKHQ